MESLFEIQGITKSERLMHTPSSFARKNLLYLQETGQLKSLKAHSCIRENLESYLFFYVIAGTGSVVYGDKEYAMSEGSCAFLDCRKHYEHKSSEEEPWELLWVHFDGQIVEACYPLFFEGNHQSPLFLAKEEKKEFIELVEELRAIPNDQNVLGELKASGLLEKLLLKCMQKAVSDTEKKENSEVAVLSSSDYESIREFLNQNFLKDNVLSELVKKYPMEQPELEKAFYHRYGISIADYIENRKFNKAKELLRFTIRPIDEIIEESELGSVEEFHRIFMENEEMSPEDYRKKWAQWIKG